MPTPRFVPLYSPIEKNGDFQNLGISSYQMEGSTITTTYNFKGEERQWQQDERDRRQFVIIEGRMLDGGFHRNHVILNEEGPFALSCDIRQVPPMKENSISLLDRRSDDGVAFFTYYRYTMLLAPSHSPSIIGRVKYEKSKSLSPMYMAFAWHPERGMKVSAVGRKL